MSACIQGIYVHMVCMCVGRHGYMYVYPYIHILHTCMHVYVSMPVCT